MNQQPPPGAARASGPSVADTLATDARTADSPLLEQSYTEAEVLSWLAPVYDEDTGNLALQQQGLKSSRKPGITLGNYQEVRIRRVHLTLDEFMAGDEQ